MKVRMGFVSNSSSSSFCIYGVCISKEDVKSSFGDRAEAVYDRFYEDGIGGPNSDYCIYFGTSFMSIRDNETGAQFKASAMQEAEKAIRKACTEAGASEETTEEFVQSYVLNSFGAYEEGWYDG